MKLENGNPSSGAKVEEGEAGGVRVKKEKVPGKGKDRVVIDISD